MKCGDYSSQILIPRFVRQFSCPINQLEQFDFSQNQHIYKLDLDLAGNPVNENSNAWKLIPSTLSILSLQNIPTNPDVAENGKLFGISIPKQVSDVMLVIRMGKLDLDAIHINSEPSNYSIGIFKKQKRWIKINIGCDTKLKLMFGPSIHFSAISCNSEISDNINCSKSKRLDRNGLTFLFDTPAEFWSIYGDNFSTCTIM
ncbi:unnamed protein product [Ambrosiozyma monospora]|uniref:Unnamed protein product n=1 Tax=Ambrosiozyma monospora TaxID=43982 RepID=A0ACB5U2P6_AMBMO|nr:unnamed protein product [Ambrosiozyma monospora]